MKAIIAGSREGARMDDIQRAVNRLAFETKELIAEVVCGMARGADLLGKQWAERMGIPVKEMPANWQPDGPTGRTDKAAGHKRNRAMAEYADALIAIWDGKSPGTKGMIKLAEKKGIPMVVVNYGMKTAGTRFTPGKTKPSI